MVYLPRPAAARDEGQEIHLVRVDELQRRAERVTVTIGRLSAREAEVISGLEPGDRVILAEMSDHDNHDILRISLNNRESTA